MVHKKNIIGPIFENINNECKWLHEYLEDLPIFTYPFDLDNLPSSGIYFFYEKDETWGHGGSKPRIVRIGSCKTGNFKSRISEHFLLDERKMNFSVNQAAPKERSIFRKNIGRALLNKWKSDYLNVWEVDYTAKDTRKNKSYLRDIKLEKKVENEITRILRENFSFRFIGMENELGSRGLEGRLIGTVAQCESCNPSKNWLGQYSPETKIRESGLWLVQHLTHSGIIGNDKEKILHKQCRRRPKAPCGKY